MLQSRTKLFDKVFLIMSTFLCNETISETTPLRKAENPLPQCNIASYKRPWIRLSFEYTTTLLSGDWGEGRTGTATIFRKMLLKYSAYNFLNNLVQDCVQGDSRFLARTFARTKQKRTNKLHFTEAVLSTKFHATLSSHRKTRPHIRFL